MLGGIDTPLHWPTPSTAFWMVSVGVLAALAHWLYFSVYRGLPEWRIRYLRWRGMEVTPGDIAETRGYRPHPPTPPLDGMFQALLVGVIVAIWIWTGDYNGRQAEAITKATEGVLLAGLLWFGRPRRADVGAPAAAEPEQRSEHSWWSVLFLLGFATVIWFDAFETRALPYLIGAAVAAGGFWLWRWWNAPEELREPLLPHAEVPREAVLGFLAAMAIVITLLAIFITLAL